MSGHMCLVTSLESLLIFCECYWSVVLHVVYSLRCKCRSSCSRQVLLLKLLWLCSLVLALITPSLVHPLHISLLEKMKTHSTKTLNIYQNTQDKAGQNWLKSALRAFIRLKVKHTKHCYHTHHVIDPGLGLYRWPCDDLYGTFHCGGHCLVLSFDLSLRFYLSSLQPLLNEPIIFL